MIDVRLGSLASILDKFFDGLSAGNQGRADVEELQWNDKNHSFDFKIKVRHHHVFSEKILHKDVILNVYDVTTYVKGTVFPTDLNQTEIKFCIDTPVGQKCIDLHLIIEYVRDLLKDLKLIK